MAHTVINPTITADLVVNIPLTITVNVPVSTSYPESDHKIEYGVGIGVGVPSFFVALFAFIHQLLKSRRKQKEKKGAEQTTQPAVGQEEKGEESGLSAEKNGNGEVKVSDSQVAEPTEVPEVA